MNRSLTFLALACLASPTLAQDRVRVTVSVDWEGRTLEEPNLAAMEAFREALPDVPLTQFLNAAYYTKKGADREAVTRAIRRTLREADETGLHIHAWRTLIETAGVEFRDRPNLWGEEYELIVSPDGDVGHEVDLSAYTLDELRAIASISRAILKEAGFEMSPSFRCGAWMAEPHVLAAVRAEGFRVDTSATDEVWHDEIAGYDLFDRIEEVWPAVEATTQPYRIETPHGAVVEMPDTCALADYVTAAEMVAHLREAAGRLSRGDIYVHIGFHQESAARYAQRVIDAIREVRRDRDAPYVFETLETAARRVAPDVVGR